MYFLVLLVIVLLIIVTKWPRNNVSNVPEPKKLPLIGNMFQLFGFSGNVWDALQATNKLYPIYKVSHPFTSTVQICNVDDLQIILSGKDHTEKSVIYQWLQAWLGTGLLTSKGKKWHYRRKLLTPAFHFNILQEFCKVFKEHSEVLVDKLEKECDKPYVDVFSFMSHFTLHIICETAMGIQLDESKKETREYIEAAHNIGIMLFQRLRRPWLYFDCLFFLSADKREELRTLKILHNFTTSVIQKRKKTFIESDVVKYNKIDGNFVVKKRLALLDLLLTLKHHGADISDEGIKEEVDTFTFEGHETTANVLSFGLMLIANDENVQNKILDEIQQVTNNFNKKIDFEDLPKLRYLEIVIKEILRVYPSVPVLGRKTDADIYTSAGYFIPKGTFVALQIYSIHHNDKYFINPEKFDPDRFLPDNCKDRHPYAYVPFSAGPRNCIGQKFGIMEIKMIMTSVIQHFKLIPVDTPSTIKILTNLTLRTKDGIKVKFERRT